MKLRIKAFITAWLLFATAFANKTLGQVVMLRPHETIANKQDMLGAIKVFLAGTIDMGNSVDWQTLIAKRFEAFGGKWLLFNPRQEHWDASRPGEMDYLEVADLIIMNFMEKSKSPISLLEMGLFARSGKMYVVCPQGFYRYDNVRITCARYGVPLYNTLEQLLKDKIKR